MMKLNLKKKDEPKSKISLHVYNSDMETLKNLSDTSGISLQNLIRHAINNMLDEVK